MVYLVYYRRSTSTFGVCYAPRHDSFCILGQLELSHYFDGIQYPDFTPSVIVSIGVAMSIDYALFMMTRWLSEMEKGRTPDEAMLKALSTAGRTVAVSGFIMFVSNAGLYFIDSTIISSFGVGLAACNLVTIAVNLTLLPALIQLFGMPLVRLGRWVEKKLHALEIARAQSLRRFREVVTPCCNLRTISV